MENRSVISQQEAAIAGIIGRIQGYCDSIRKESKEAGSVACAGRILELVASLIKVVLTPDSGEVK